jgi:hypothetical protein
LSCAGELWSGGEEQEERQHRVGSRQLPMSCGTRMGEGKMGGGSGRVARGGEEEGSGWAACGGEEGGGV